MSNALLRVIKLRNTLCELKPKNLEGKLKKAIQLCPSIGNMFFHFMLQSRRMGCLLYAKCYFDWMEIGIWERFIMVLVFCIKTAHRLGYTFACVSLSKTTSLRLLQVICKQVWMKSFHLTMRFSWETTLNSGKHSFGNGLKETAGIQSDSVDKNAKEYFILLRRLTSCCGL